MKKELKPPKLCHVLALLGQTTFHGKCGGHELGQRGFRMFLICFVTLPLAITLSSLLVISLAEDDIEHF